MRATHEKKDRWRWRLAFRTARRYTPGFEAVVAIEKMNGPTFEGERKAVEDLSCTFSEDGPFLFFELYFTADDEAANGARLAAMGAAVPKSGHLTRISAAE